jgi:Holliday junction resolvasome RuvABC DNA-binding subunit
MALSPAAKRLKNLKKGKSDKPEMDEKDAKPKAEAKADEGGDMTEEEMNKALEDLGGGETEIEETEVTESVEMGGKDDANMAGDDAAKDPVKVVADVLDLDDITAQAVYGEAMAMAELSDMSPEQMAKKIKGNYDMLKKIIMSMGEKAAMAMKDQMNQPMDMPGGEMPAGPDMGGPPMGAPAPGGMGPMA